MKISKIISYNTAREGQKLETRLLEEKGVHRTSNIVNRQVWESYSISIGVVKIARLQKPGISKIPGFSRFPNDARTAIFYFLIYKISTVGRK